MKRNNNWKEELPQMPQFSVVHDNQSSLQFIEKHKIHRFWFALIFPNNSNCSEQSLNTMNSLLLHAVIATVISKLLKY